MNFRISVLVSAVLFCVCIALDAQTAPLGIVDEPLPTMEAGVEFHTFLHANGGVPPYVWSVASGDMPEGISLSPEGLIEGRPTKAGSFDLMLKVEDSGRPPHTISKEFKMVVSAALLLEWLDPPKVHDNRIDGSVQVSNGSTSSFDLTVVIVAVAENGRATAIGYEHLAVKPGTANLRIPFGNTLPFGAYVVHADAIAEISAKNAILRQRLQTPQALQIVQGP